MSKHTRWLKAEVERWVAEDLISAAQGAAIRARYASPASSLSWGLIVFFGMGAVIVGLGVILLFAYNWDEIPKFGKLALIFGGIAAAHAGGLRLRRHSDWRQRLGEALSLLGTMAFGAGIWLVAQIYHIDEHYPNGFLIWAFGALALAWVLESIPQGLLAVVLLAIWGGAEALDFAAPADSAALLIALGLAPLAWRLRSGLLLGAVLVALYWLILCNATHWGGSATAFGNAVALSVLLVALGKFAPAWRPGGVESRVFAFFGFAGFVLCAYLLTFHDLARPLIRSWHAVPDSMLEMLAYRWLVFLLAAAAWTRLLLQWTRGARELVEREEWLLPIGLIYVQGATVFGAANDDVFVALVFNLVCLGLAAAWMVRGCREGSFRPIVLGSMLLALVIFARYFDLFDSLAARGLAFLVFGGLLFAEGFYYRRLRRAENEADGP